MQLDPLDYGKRTSSATTRFKYLLRDGTDSTHCRFKQSERCSSIGTSKTGLGLLAT